LLFNTCDSIKHHYLCQDDTESKSNEEEMLAEYNFTNGVRGKHYKAYRRGHTVTVHQEGGTKQVQHFTPEDGAVMLDPYVQQYFPDSDAVNYASRSDDISPNREAS
jgi:hypothetical protein